MSAIELLEHVRRLDRHYRKRFSNEDLEHQAREFGRKAAGYDAMTVRRAVDRLIDDEPHYPTPAKLAAACAAVRERQSARDQVRPDTHRCHQCGTPATARTWYRRPRTPAEVGTAATSAPEGFLRKFRDYCDCQWRCALHYRDEEELQLMGGPADPDIAQELRRRARLGITPRRPRLQLITATVGRPVPSSQETA